MKASLTVKLGNSNLTVESEGTEQIIVQDLTFWSTLPKECGACQSANIQLSYRKPKGFDYYGLKCDDCGCNVNFGQSREGNKFFLAWDAKWEKFTPKADDGLKAAPKSRHIASPVSEEDIQF